MMRPPLILTPIRPGDAQRIAEFCERAGLRLMPWQRELLTRWEAASR